MTDEKQCESIWNKFCSSDDLSFELVSSGVIWTSAEFKSACPPRKKKKQAGEEIKSLDKDVKDDVDPSISEKSPYRRPSDTCPGVKSYCYIKMQDPCKPCCCDDKPKLPPCPPKRGPQRPREPICGCELCQKNPGHEKCCIRKNKDFRDININRKHFEKA